jgi:hypothetical protein
MDSDRNVDDIAASFGALSNPLRVRILLALTETRRADWDHEGMSYSDLRAAVAAEDGGRFNYHLDELRGQFVRGKDGHYWLTSAGSRVVDEIYAGTFSGAPEGISGPVRRSCPEDGKPREATFEDGVLSVSCPEHGTVFDMWLRFGAAADRDLEELFAWANRRGLWYLESVSWDVCPHCAGQFGEATFRPAGGDDSTDTAGSVIVDMTCDSCAISFGIPAHQYALTRPPTIAFLHDHGIDYRSLAVEYGAAEWAHETTRTDSGVLVCFTVDGERLELELGQSLETQSYRRDSARA